jgi:6-phosphogluconolactonase (cycloisomerase 2 family)
MVADPRGKFLYVTNVPKIGSKATILGYRIDPRSETLSGLPISPFGSSQSGNGITITPEGAFLYSTDFNAKSVSGFAIYEKTGGLRPLQGSPFKAGDVPERIVSCRRIGDRCKPAAL